MGRLSLGIIAGDFWATLTVRSSGRPDIAARILLVGVPVLVGTTSWLSRFELSEPTALLPAVTLLAGVLLAASGQLISLRARVADSVLASARPALRLHFRGSISAVLLTAVMSLVDALLLGALAVAASNASTAVGAQAVRVALTGLALGATSFVVLMFIYTCRRLYTAYLETFEDGLAVTESPRTLHAARPEAQDPLDDPEGTTVVVPNSDGDRGR